MIELDGRRFTSENHGQGLTHELHSKISANNKSCGQLRVFYPEDKPFLVPEEQRLIDAVASDLERWLERKQIDEALQERLKEITCLYEIRRGMGLELSLDHACQHIFKHLIPAMQFPGNCYRHDRTRRQALHLRESRPGPYARAAIENQRQQ